MNFDSADWNEIVSGINERLSELDRRNRSSKLNLEETQALRGEINALVWILDWQSRISQADIASYELIQ